jgi:autotransporter-associated beta strand protein
LSGFVRSNSASTHQKKRKMKTQNLTKLFGALLVSTLPLISASAAGTDTWIGDTDANWNTAANWTTVGGSTPPANGDSLVFGAAGTAGTSLNNDISGLSINKLTFSSGASDFTFGGNGLTLAGGIDASALSSGTETFNYTTTIGQGAQRWNVGAGATLALGTITAGAAVADTYGPNGAIALISSTGTKTTFNLNGWDWRGPAGTGKGLLGPGMVIDNGDSTYDWAGVNGGTIGAVNYFAAGTGDRNNVLITANTTLSLNASWASVKVDGATFTVNGTQLYIDTGIILQNGGTVANKPIKSNSDGLYVYVPNSGTISSPIQNNGATAKLLYKAGPGTLTLSGANTYTGNTVIYEGALVQSTAATGAGGYVVKDGATLGVSGSGTLKMSSLSFGNSTNNFSSVSTTAAAITNTGALTLAGTVTVNVSGSLTAAQYQLINYASITGTGGFVMGTVPAGWVGSIATNGNTIVLDVSVDNSLPACGGVATPNPVNLRDSAQFTVTVTNGGSPTISSVVMNASAIGGSSSLALVYAGTDGSGYKTYTNTVLVSSTPAAYGSPVSLPVTVTDGNSNTGSANISLTVNAPTFSSTDTWVGNTDTNWNTSANWTYSPGSGPVVSGDSLVFGAAGSAGLTLNNNISGLTINKLTFNSGADSFTFGGNNLTIGTGGIDASALSSGTETINFGITPAAGVQRWNVGAGATLALGSLPTQFGPAGGIVIISSTSAITTTAANGWDWRGGGLGLLGPGFVIDNGDNTYDWAASTGSLPYTIAAATYMAAGAGDKNNVQVAFDTTVSPNASWASLLVNGATLTHNGANLYIDTGIILENGGVINGSGPIKANNDGLYIYVPDAGTISSSIQNNGANVKLLYKAGPGTLTLSGASTYTGNTVIYDGALIQSTAATGAGGYVVKDGATLGVSVVSGGTLKMSSLTFGNSTNTFAGIGTTSAAITNTGALTLAGTVTVNVSGLVPVGQYPLIDSASIGGTGGFVVGSLASGVVANIVTNGNTIVLNVTASAPPSLLWTGLNDNSWDFSTGNNWLSNAVSSIYSDGQIVQFDDSSTQTNVSIAAPVSPLLLTVSNSASPYTFSGAAITGVGSLTKSGNGTLILANANTYSGGTTISNGVLQLGDGLSYNGSVAGNITDNGTLIFANPLDQTFAGVISGTGSMIKTSYGNLTLGVNNTYAGGTLLDNYSTVTLPNGAVQAFGTGALTLSNATVYVKPGGGSSYNSGNSVYLGNSVVIPAGTTSTIDNSQNSYGNLWVGGDGVQWTGSGTVAIQNSTAVNSAAVLWNGNPLAGFTGTLNIGALYSGTMYVGIGYNSGNGGTGASVPTFDASGVAFALDAGGGSTLCQVVDQNCTALKFGSLAASSPNTVLRGNSSSSPANQLTIEAGALNTSTTFAGKITDWGSSGTALTKVGSGTLTLSGANTYTGNTTINGGTLELAQSVATLATNSTVLIASGAYLQLTDGTVTNQVAGLVTNGVAAGIGIYSSANSSGFITGDGYLQVGTIAPAPEPINASYDAGTGQLTLSWTQSGWRLECQTNNITTGLNPAGWTPVTGAASPYVITVDPEQPTVFYRLAYP